MTPADLETAALAADTDHGFDAQMFQRFLSFDIGEGPPIYWHSLGKLYRQPKGEIIAGVEALVSNRRVVHDETSAAAVCRTILLYRDPETGAVLEDEEGNHILREYPYIVARFELQERRMVIDTEGLSGPHQGGRFGLARVSNDKVFAHHVDESSFFSWTLFGQVDTPMGQVWFIESYNASTPPDVMVMNRFGTLPAFAGAGDGLLQTVARRYDDYGALPAGIRAYVEENAPEHVKPPQDLDEVAEIRARYLDTDPAT